MSTDFKELKKHLDETTRKLAGKIPTVLGGFSQLHKSAIAAGSLDSMTKELLALAIAIALRCEGCIAYHVSAALKQGATPEQVSETIGVAIMMGGGPAVIYGCEAFEALEQFAGAS